MCVNCKLYQYETIEYEGQTYTQKQCQAGPNDICPMIKDREAGEVVAPCVYCGTDCDGLPLIEGDYICRRCQRDILGL